MEEDKKEEIYKKIINLFLTSLKENKNMNKLTLLSEMVNILKDSFSYMDWVGFYLYDDKKKELYLGPYIGSDACEIISLDKGVCGKCYTDKKVQLDNDVSKLPYHIACSSSTKSEIVIPVIKKDEVLGVLDIDSDALDSFSKIDSDYLKSLCYLLTR